MKKEFLISLCFFFPLAVGLSWINYSIKEHLFGSILFGCIGAAGVFFVPYLFKGVRKKKKLT